MDERNASVDKQVLRKMNIESHTLSYVSYQNES